MVWEADARLHKFTVAPVALFPSPSLPSSSPVTYHLYLSPVHHLCLSPSFITCLYRSYLSFVPVTYHLYSILFLVTNTCHPPPLTRVLWSFQFVSTLHVFHCYQLSPLTLLSTSRYRLTKVSTHTSEVVTTTMCNLSSPSTGTLTGHTSHLSLQGGKVIGAYSHP